MAAQPSRKPPNNVLFCGPPPSLPPIVILPNSLLSDSGNPNSVTKTILESIEYPHGLQEINNVGLPTLDNQNSEIIDQTFTSDNIHENYSFCSFLRRAKSCNISDLYLARNTSEKDIDILRHIHSEPDFSKYDLYLETDIMVENPMTQVSHSLVLNNPFYDSSNAYDPIQSNHNMVVLPENYLAFEDSFVPSCWDYKPEILVGNDMNAGVFYEEMPLIPPNDPWSHYDNSNDTFEYYSPQFDMPLENCVQYMRITDLDSAIPQYMSLPPECPDKEKDTIYTIEDNTHKAIEGTDEFVDAQTVNFAESKQSPSPINFKDDMKECIADSLTNRKSSTRSDEESVNADISVDVTSSLAFVPTSKSSARPTHCSDDTSEDTSPCSTDYHEASAVDAVQSLEELSYDSTELSQSRDEPSPTPLCIDENIKLVKSEVKMECDHNLIKSNKQVDIPLSQLPSIQSKDGALKTLPQDFLLSNGSTENLLIGLDNTLIDEGPHREESSKINNQTCKSHAPISITSSNEGLQTKPTEPILQRPLPPAVPPAWLAKQNSSFVVNQNVPQISVQNTEGLTKNFNQISKIQQQDKRHPKPEPQPSCSYIRPQPLQTSQLKPEKQPKDVEVSLSNIFIYPIF